MPDNKTTVHINVTDDGSTDKVTGRAKVLHKELKATAETAAHIPKALQAAREGVSASNRTSPASRAAKPVNTTDSADSGTSRGIGGLTGAEGRDFAKQARGLGGLVHIYATFAANLFAATAAFGALSRAADTTNMVKGLDQLGAATGRNLGTLSKRLVEVTGGALSLRDAMESVAKGSAAGLTGKQMESLAASATKASMALGINITDAMSRLTRGISKLEPELLDELGLFTKIGPATDNYARSIGKSASALTDFERRQAFANAVLQEASDKFGALTLTANPYDKLLASMKDVAQTGLELVNKVLGPLISSLSSSPTVLAGVLTGITAMLLKQAVPALSAWKDGLNNAAQAARNAVIETNKLRKEKVLDEGSEAYAASQKSLANAEAAKLKLANASAAVRKAANFDIENSTKVELDNLRKVRDERNKAAEAEMASGVIIAESTRKKRLAEQRNLEQLIATTEAHQKQSAAYKAIEEETVKNTKFSVAERIKAYWSEAAQRDRIADSAARKSQRVNIVNDAVKMAPTAGVINSWKMMALEVRNATNGLDAAGVVFANGEPKMSKFSAGLTMVRGTALLAAQGIGVLAASLGNVFAIIGLIGGAIALLDTLFSENSKEMEGFSSSLKTAEDSVINISRTIETMDKRGAFAKNTIEGITAMSNAMTELADATSTLVTRTEKALATMGWWDNFKNGVKSIFGEDLRSDMANQIASSLIAALDIAVKAGVADKYKDKLKSILNVKFLDEASIKSAISKLSDADAKKAVIVIDQIKNSLGQTSLQLTTFKTSTDTAYKSFQEFIQSTASNNPLFKLGTDIEAMGNSMTKVLEGNASDIEAAFRDIASSPQKSILFGTEFVEKFVALKPALLETANAFAAADEKIAASQKSMEAQSARVARMSDLFTRVRPTDNQLNDFKDAQSQLNTANRDLVRQIEIKAAIDTKPLDEARKLLTQGMSSALIAGGNYIATALGNASEKAALAVDKAKLGGLSGEQAAQESGRIAKAEINIQIRAINTNINLIKATEILTSKIEEANAREASEKDPTDKGAKARLDAATFVSQFLSDKNNSVLKPKDAVDKAGLGEAAANIAKLSLQKMAGALAPQLASLSEAGGQSKAIDVNTARTVAAGKVQDEQKALADKTQLLQVEKNRLELLGNISSINTQESILAQDNLDRQVMENKLKSDLLDINQRIKFDTSTEGRAKLEAVKKAIEEKGVVDSVNLSLQTKQKLLQIELALITRKTEIEKSAKEVLYAQASAAEEITTASETGYAQLNGMQDTYLNNLKYEQDLRKANFELLKASASANDAFNAKEEAARAKINSLETNKGKPGIDSTEVDRQIAAVNAELEKERALRNDSVSIAGIQYNKAVKLSEISKTISDEQARYNELLKESNDFAERLGEIFGEVGKSIGGLVSVLADIGVQAEKNAKAEMEATKARDDAKKSLEAYGTEDSDARDAAVKSLQNAEIARQKQIAKTKKDELAAAADSIGAAKKVFKEKTFAYRALDSLEKAARLAQAFNNLKAAKDAIKAGWEALKGAVPGIFGKFMEQMGPAGWVAAAAAIAALGLSGGKSGPPPAGFTAAEQQDVQGTGMSWVNGKKQENGGGALGDSSAKSESVNKSIEYIEAHTFKTLEYNNKMLSALLSIKENTGNLGKSLIRITGLTSAGEVLKGGNWLTGKTSTETLDKGVMVKGTIGQAISGKANVGTYENTKTSDSGFLGFIGGGTSYSTNTSTLKNKQVTEGLAAVFSMAVDALSEAGKELGVTGVSEFVKSINISEAFKISTMGLKGQELVDAITAQIGIEMDIAASKKFPQLETFRLMGEGMSETVVRIARNGQLANLALTSVGINLRELAETGTVATDLMYRNVDLARNALDTANADIAAANANMYQIQQGLLNSGDNGVDYSSVVKAEVAVRDAQQRVLDATDDLTAALTAVSNANNGVTTNNIAVYDSLIKLNGGLDKFLSKTEYFKDNFLTEAEKLAPVQNKLVEEMARLVSVQNSLGNSTKAAAIAAADSRAEFAAIIRGLDLTSESNRQLYADLMNVAEAFALVYPETRKVLNVEELRSQSLQQLITIMKLEGRVSEAIALQREEELSKLDDALKAGQRYIWQLEDRLSYIKAESGLLSAMGNTYEALLLDRQMELRTLRDEERVLKAKTYLAQDMLKTENLLINLTEASGDAIGALTAKRKIELRSLSNTDAAIQARIWQLQDEAKMLETWSSQEEKIYNLLGKSQEALAISRAKELEALDDRLKPAQQYIYALEDEASLRDKLKTAYENEKTAIGATITKTKDYIKVLKDFRDSLLLGDKSTLTPLEKYEESKRQAMDVANIAMGITAASEEERNAALDKLPTVSEAFLEASKMMYASSGQYSSDFSTVKNILEQTMQTLGTQETEAERQLNALQENTAILDVIKENTESTATLLGRYLAAQEATALAKTEAAGAGSVAAGGEFMALSATLLEKVALSLDAQLIFTSAMSQLLSTTLGLTGVSTTVPEIQTANTPQITLTDPVSNNVTTLQVDNSALLAELQAVRDELAAVKTTLNEQTGALITAAYDSTQQAAEATVDPLTRYVTDIEFFKDATFRFR